MNLLLELLNKLPYPLITTIAFGYMGYWITYHGFEYAKEERIFKVGVFMVPTLILFYFTNHIQIAKHHPVKSFLITLVISFITTFIIASLWRKYSFILFKVFHYFRISNDNNKGTVFNEITQNTNIEITQLKVYLKDGKTFKCNNVYKYDDCAIKFFRTDKDNNIAFYVDEVKSLGEIAKVIDPKDTSLFGDQITWIPKEEIKYIDFRIISKSEKKKREKQIITTNL